MATRVLHRLNAAKVRNIKSVGSYEDGGGLRLVVAITGAKRWVMRVTINDRRRELGLGGYPFVSLEAARTRASEIREAAKEGRDLIRERRSEQQRTQAFRLCFEEVYDLRRERLSNRKALLQWRSTMETYVFPSIGDLPVAEIQASHVLAVLRPIWFAKPETGKRVLQRMETVFRSVQDRLKKGKERLDNALEGLALICEPVDQPKGELEHIHYFCGNTEVATDLKQREPQRVALYKGVVSLVRAYANIADELSTAGYTAAEIADIKQRQERYLALREIIRKASGETLDLKAYEADMRHLIDTYIEAAEPRKISPFDNIGLLDLIVNSGIAEAINNLPKGIKGNKDAVAEPPPRRSHGRTGPQQTLPKSVVNGMETAPHG